MALFATNARCLYITLFVVVAVVFGIGQLAYISPNKALANLQDQSARELAQLRHEVSSLKEEKQSSATEFSKVKESLEKQVAQLRTEQSRLKELVPGNNDTIEEEEQAPLTDKGLIDLVNAPQNVVTNKDTLVYLVNNFNTYGEVRNADKFTLDPDFIPIVIRVYNKHEYFGWALENYKKVKDINKTMMIVSHDGIFPEMFKLVQAIDFCQVKQIVHPYSGHLLKNRFPGPDNRTIPDSKDQYGNPRPFPHTALKHHFWWHLNFVWDQFLGDHKGDMVFMEEDHVPTTDYYQSVKALRTIRNERCPDCFNAKIHQHKHTDAGIHDLFLSHDLGNVGMIFSREKWEQLRKAGKQFCTFDDYNWDWTMGFLTATSAISPLSLTAAFPRAEHMGKCGTHASSGLCEITAEDKHHFEEVNDRLQVDGGNWEKYNYNPTPVDGPHSVAKGWGGWAHPMDQQHCMDQIKKT